MHAEMRDDVLNVALDVYTDGYLIPLSYQAINVLEESVWR